MAIVLLLVLEIAHIVYRLKRDRDALTRLDSIEDRLSSLNERISPETPETAPELSLEERIKLEAERLYSEGVSNVLNYDYTKKRDE